MTIREFIRLTIWHLGHPGGQPPPEEAEQAVRNYVAQRRAAAAARDEQEVLQLIDERDDATDWADRLAYAIAPMERIGEHSNGNDPWANALEIQEAANRADHNIPDHPARHAPREALSAEPCGPDCPGHETVRVCTTCGTNWPCEPTRTYRAGVAATLDQHPTWRPGWL